MLLEGPVFEQSGEVLAGDVTAILRLLGLSRQAPAEVRRVTGRGLSVLLADRLFWIPARRLVHKPEALQLRSGDTVLLKALEEEGRGIGREKGLRIDVTKLSAKVPAAPAGSGAPVADRDPRFPQGLGGDPTSATNVGRRGLTRSPSGQPTFDHLEDRKGVAQARLSRGVAHLAAQLAGPPNRAPGENGMVTSRHGRPAATILRGSRVQPSHSGSSLNESLTSNSYQEPLFSRVMSPQRIAARKAFFKVLATAASLVVEVAAGQAVAGRALRRLASMLCLNISRAEHRTGLQLESPQASRLPAGGEQSSHLMTGSETGRTAQAGTEKRSAVLKGENNRVERVLKLAGETAGGLRNTLAALTSDLWAVVAAGGGDSGESSGPGPGENGPVLAGSGPAVRYEAGEPDHILRQLGEQVLKLQALAEAMGPKGFFIEIPVLWQGHIQPLPIWIEPDVPEDSEGTAAGRRGCEKRCRLSMQIPTAGLGTVRVSCNYNGQSLAVVMGVSDGKALSQLESHLDTLEVVLRRRFESVNLECKLMANKKVSCQLAGL